MILQPIEDKRLIALFINHSEEVENLLCPACQFTSIVFFARCLRLISGQGFTSFSRLNNNVRTVR